jgi:hypothetical protein
MCGGYKAPFGMQNIYAKVSIKHKLFNCLAELEPNCDANPHIKNTGSEVETWGKSTQKAHVRLDLHFL